MSAMKTLTSNTERSGDELTAPETLLKVVSSLSHDNRRVIMSGTSTLQSMATKKESHAASIVESGALVPLRALLESFDVDVKEGAVKAMTAIAAAGENHMQALLDDATLESLVVNLNAGDSPITLRTAIARFFDVCCAYGAAPATRVMDGGSTAGVAQLARDAASALPTAGEVAASPRARAVAFACLAQMSRHADDLAARVVESGAITDAVAALIDPANPGVREAAAAMAREIASKTADLAERVAADGGVAALVQNLQLERGERRAMLSSQTLGYIADFRPSFAVACVAVDQGKCLVDTLDTAADDDVAVAAAWAMGCAARHGKESAGPLARSGAMKTLLENYVNVVATDALRDRAKASLKGLIRNCGDLSLIEPLVSDETPPVILRHVLSEFGGSKLSADVAAKRSFVTSGGLMRLQGVLKAHDKGVEDAAKAVEHAKKAGEPPPPPHEGLLDDRALKDAKSINSNFPPEVVSYYLYC